MTIQNTKNKQATSKKKNKIQNPKSKIQKTKKAKDQGVRRDTRRFLDLDTDPSFGHEDRNENNKCRVDTLGD